MQRNYALAEDVKKVATKLLPQFPHLAGVRIEYVFAEKTPRRNGKDVWGLARKIGSLSAFLAGDENDQGDGYTEEFFCITISRDVWDVINDKQREALVYHEMCHCKVERETDGSGNVIDTKLSLFPHDLEEFEAVVKKYGLWREDVRSFLATAREIKE